MNDAQMRAFAEATVTGSRRHAIFSLVVCAAVDAFEVSVHAGLAVHAGVLSILAFLLVYNVLRARLARRAIEDGTSDALRRFAQGQKRSHLLRGRVFLVACPMVVIGGWVATVVALRTTQQPVLFIAANVASTAFLAWGWVFWWRGLRRVRRWNA